MSFKVVLCNQAAQRGTLLESALSRGGESWSVTCAQLSPSLMWGRWPWLGVDNGQCAHPRCSGDLRFAYEPHASAKLIPHSAVLKAHDRLIPNQSIAARFFFGPLNC